MGLMQEVKEAGHILKDAADFSGYETLADERLDYVVTPDLSKKFTWDTFLDDGLMGLKIKNAYAAIYELTSLPTEGQSEAYIESTTSELLRCFSKEVFPHYKASESPWVMQVFVADDYDLSQTMNDYIAAGHERVQGSKFNKIYASIIQSHFAYMQKDGGIFVDPLSATEFKAKTRKIYLMMYRRMHAKSGSARKKFDPLKDTRDLMEVFEEKLKSTGIEFKRIPEKQFHAWMFSWFSPAPKGFDGPADFLGKVPFPAPDARHESFDLLSSCFSSNPVSDKEKGFWYFDGKPHTFIPVRGLHTLPKGGALTAEREVARTSKGVEIYAPFDKLPQGSIFTMAITLQDVSDVASSNTTKIRQATKTKDSRSKRIGEAAQRANHLISSGGNIFPVSMGFYLSGNDDEDIEKKETKLYSLMSSKMGFRVVADDEDRRKLERYVRHLPLNYSPKFDHESLFQSRLFTDQQIASLLPICGRSRGSGSMLHSFWNRLAEPMFMDFLKDRENNSHLFGLGTSGSGKSNFIAYLVTQLVAFVNPRLLLIDAGKSFEWVITLFELLGLKVNRIEVGMDTIPKYTMNPYVETRAMVQQLEELEKLNRSLGDVERAFDVDLENTQKEDGKLNLQGDIVSKADNSDSAPDTDKQNSSTASEGENRSYLTEFLSATILFVTGGEQREIDKIDRSLRHHLLEAIKESAYKALADGYNEFLPSDLANTLIARGKTLAEEEKKSGMQSNAPQDVIEMGQGIQTFLGDSLSNIFFNRRAPKLPEADINYFEVGLWKDGDKNDAPKALAIIGLMQDAMSKAEAKRTEGRPTIIIADECHCVTSKPITAASVIQIAKMGRKVNCWAWMFTQNVDDFPASARKALSNLENKILLASSPDDREKIYDFIDISPERKQMYESVTKQPGKYVEFLHATSKSALLCKNIPPREILALAMTDPDEIEWRTALMKKYQCNGVVASFIMAQVLRGEEECLAKAEAILDV